MMSPTKHPSYSVRLLWRWREARPRRRALAGLDVLMRFLGFEVRSVFHGARGCTLNLRPAVARQPLDAAEAERRIRAWQPFVLADYPGSTWEVRVLGPPWRGEAGGEPPDDRSADTPVAA